jgi:DNA-directed RNA polymerase specialized sigma24 family protein
MDASDPRVDHRTRRRAFSDLVVRFQPMVYGCAVGILSDPMLADDAAQEAFITA